LKYPAKKVLTVSAQLADLLPSVDVTVIRARDPGGHQAR